MKIVLLGSNGQVGWELQRALAPLGEVLALDRDRADLSQPEQVAAMVRAAAPAVVVNAAAYTAVDKAETEAGLAQTINAEAPGAIARACADTGAWLLHYGSDYVFGGGSSRPWREDDATAPLSAYGRSKRDGEVAIRASGCRHLILRTSWVYGARGANFAKTMLRLAAERDRLTVIDDQVGAPTGAELLADLSAQLLPRVHAQAELGGTYHVAAAGEVSWHGYARHVIALARLLGLALRVADEAIVPIATRDWPTPATRPLNSRLDTKKLRATFGLHLPPWQHGVERMLREICTP